MTSQASGLSFVTHLEIEGLLGGGPSAGQQRRRLEGRGLLPGPGWVRADRQRLGILPEFVLAALVVPVRKLDPHHVALFEAIVRDTERLYTSASFRRLTEAVRESLPAFDSTTLGTGLVDRLAREYPQELDAWRVDVATVAADLGPLGLGIEAEPGYIAATDGDTYVLKGLGAELTESHPRSDAPFDLSDGAWVVRDRVHAISSARDFLLPSHKPERAKAEAIAVPALDEDEAMFEEMFGSLEKPPRSIRRLPLSADEEPRIDVSDAPPQLAQVPVRLLEGFTPMSRPRA
jgi:hypothetical protein